MIDLLEVSLFTKLIIRGSCLLSNNPGFVELLLQHGELIRKLRVLTIDLWDLRQVGWQDVVSLMLTHLLLEDL